MKLNITGLQVNKMVKQTKFKNNKNGGWDGSDEWG